MTKNPEGTIGAAVAFSPWANVRQIVGWRGSTVKAPARVVDVTLLA
jgi:hypothetical protein